MYKKAWCTCKVVVLLIKPIVFLPFSLPSASSLLKLPIDTIFSYENLHVVQVVVLFLKPQDRKLAGDRQRSILTVIIQNYQGLRKIKLCSTPRLHFSQISLELHSFYSSSGFVTNSCWTCLVKNHESKSRTNESQLKKKRVRNGKCLGVYVTKQLIWRQTSKPLDYSVLKWK